MKTDLSNLEESSVEFSKVLPDPLDMKPGPYPDSYEIAGTLWSGDLLRLFGLHFPTPTDYLFSVAPDEHGNMTITKYMPEEAIEWAEKQLAK